MDAPYQLNAPFLADLFVDAALLSWNPPASASDLAKRVIAVLQLFREEPARVTPAMIGCIVHAPGSQIQDKDTYLVHVTMVGRLYRDFSRRLLEKYPALDLPVPEEAFAHGLVHDLNAAYSDYSKTGQDSKEIDLYFHARTLGIPAIARHIALHGAYLEILELINEGFPFPHAEAYAPMRHALHHDHLYHDIQQEFAAFVKGEGNLPLMTVTVADFLALPDLSDRVSDTLTDPENFDALFSARMSDIVSRHYASPLERGQSPSASGIALIERGGFDRARLYHARIKQLLFGSTDDGEKLKHDAPGLWKTS